MLKRLPILCAALLALAACSQNSDNNAAAPTAPAAPAGTAANVPTPTPAGTSAPAAAGSTVLASESSAAAPAPASTPAVAAQPFVDNGKWVEGKNYFLIDPAQPTDQPGKIVVTEVFSYACPACNHFHTTVDKIASELPSNAVINYLPAAFRPDENWPLFQRTFYAAQALDVADKAHDAMFDAVWKSGELASYDLKTGRLNPQAAWPTLDDVAKFYAKYGVDPKTFVGVANSFSINTKMKRADALIKAYGVEGTPTMVIDGKYRFDVTSAGGYAQAIELTQWLVAKEAAGK